MLFSRKNYNFESIGDLLEYRKYLECEIKKYEQYVYFIPLSCYILYIVHCYHALGLVNYLIYKKGYK